MGEYSNYTIKQGDTLSAIAKRAGTTVEQLAKENGIKDPDKIIAGSTLKLPKGAEISVFNAKISGEANVPENLFDIAASLNTPKDPLIPTQNELNKVRDIILKEREKSQSPLSETISEWINKLPMLKELKVLGSNDEDDYPLDSSGRLRRGWEYNPETGEYRKIHREGPLRLEDRNTTWIPGGSSLGAGRQTQNYIPAIDDYEPIFELKDGKLVQTGKVPIEKEWY